MKKLLEKISLKLGLTKTEVITMAFVLSTFTFGLFINRSNPEFLSIDEKKFNYNFQDSLFEALKSNNYNRLSSEKNVEKMVDSEPELLDFSRRKKESKKKNILILKQSSININTADVIILTKLPGIGKKTAEKIVRLRNNKGGFSSLDELTEVKGMGKKKLNRIKEYIYLDK